MGRWHWLFHFFIKFFYRKVVHQTELKFVTSQRESLFVANLKKKSLFEWRYLLNYTRKKIHIFPHCRLLKRPASLNSFIKYLINKAAIIEKKNKKQKNPFTNYRITRQPTNEQKKKKQTNVSKFVSFMLSSGSKGERTQL